MAEHDERNEPAEAAAHSEADAPAEAVATAPAAGTADSTRMPEEAAAGPATESDGEEKEGEEEEEAYDDEEYGEEAEEHVVVIRRGLFWGVAAAAILIIAALAGLNIYQALRGNDPAVAVVNGERIPRSAYDKLIARSDGQQALNQLINQTLLAQDAAKHHVTVSPDELDAELQKQKASFASDSEYRQALAQAHFTEPELREQLKYQVLLNKMVLDKVTVSDSEIQQEYDQNKDTTYQGKTLDQVKDQIKQDLLQQKQAAAEQAYFDRLHAEAKITQHLPGS